MPASYTAQTLLQLSPRAALRTASEDICSPTSARQTALLKSYAVLQGTLERPNVGDLAEIRAQSDPDRMAVKAMSPMSLLGPEIIAYLAQRRPLRGHGRAS